MADHDQPLDPEKTHTHKFPLIDRTRARRTLTRVFQSMKMDVTTEWKVSVDVDGTSDKVYALELSVRFLIGCTYPPISLLNTIDSVLDYARECYRRIV